MYGTSQKFFTKFMNFCEQFMEVHKLFVYHLWTSLCVTINKYKWMSWAPVWVIQWTDSQSSSWTNEGNIINHHAIGLCTELNSYCKVMCRWAFTNYLQTFVNTSQSWANLFAKYYTYMSTNFILKQLPYLWYNLYHNECGALQSVIKHTLHWTQLYCNPPMFFSHQNVLGSNLPQYFYCQNFMLYNT